MSATAADATSQDVESQGLPGTTLAAGIAILIAHLPCLAMYAFDLEHDGYQFAFFVPFGAIFLAWTALIEGNVPVGRSNRVLWAIAQTLGIGVLVLAGVVGSGVLGMVSLIVNATAFVYGVGGLPLLARLAPALLFLCFAVKIPWVVHNSLQGLATRWTSSVLDAIGVIHLRSGHIITLPDETFFVAEACSGLKSLLWMIAGTAFYALWARLNILHAVILTGFATVWVLFGNITRLVSVTIANKWWGVDLTKDLPHQLFGIAVLVGVVTLIFSSDQLIRLIGIGLQRTGILRPLRSRWRRWSEETSLAAKGRTSRSASLGLPWGAAPAVLFGALFLAQAFLVGPALGDLYSAGTAADFRELATEDVLPKTWEGWTLADHWLVGRKEDDVYGGNVAAYWLYRRGEEEMTFIFAYPFLGWHDAAYCLRNLGWEMQSQYAVERTIAEQPVCIEETDLLEPYGRYVFLQFGLFDGSGQSLVSPKLVRSELGLSRLRALRLAYQAELLRTSPDPLSDEHEEESRRLFEEAWIRFLERFAD